MAGDGGVTNAHLWGWGVTFLAFLGNLLWNLLNRRHTNKTAATLRGDQYNRETWSLLRARIQDRLDRFVEQVEEGPATLRTVPSSRKIDSKLEEINYQIVARQDRLARVLGEADNSIYALGYSWQVSANGMKHSSDTSWDLLLKQIEDAADQSKNRRYRIDALADAKFYAVEIEKTVRDKIMEQDALLHPDR